MAVKKLPANPTEFVITDSTAVYGTIQAGATRSNNEKTVCLTGLFSAL